MTSQRIGWPPISTSAFRIACVSSRKRVPLPPQWIATGMSAAQRELARTGDCRKDRHVVALCQRGCEPGLEADVLTGDIDVDEAAKGAVLGDALTQPVVLVEDRVKRFADRPALDLELALAARCRAE